MLFIEKLKNTYDAYCMEVVGPNNEQDRHNFAICGKNENGEYQRNGTFVSNCKYGDNFVGLYGERKKGITSVRQLVNYEIERFERVQEGKMSIKFKERMTGDEFNTFEMAHFRLLGDDKMIPYGSCLDGNTLIKTIDGVKKIKNITIDDTVLSFDVKTQTKVESKVLDKIHSGKKETYKISTKHNYIDSSKEHKLLLYDNKINDFRYEFVENIKLGDKLVINFEDSNNELKNVNKTVVSTFDRIKREFKYFQNIDYIPDNMTIDFARFIGFMYGDGWISQEKNVMFALGEHSSLNIKYLSLLEKFSGVKPRLLKPHTETSYEFSQAVVGSKMLATILIRLGFIGKAHTKSIPQWVFNSSYEIREAFLDGFVDADGSLFIDKWNCCRYSIELCNKDLIAQLKYLVQSLGYKSGKLSTRTKLEGSSIIRGRVLGSTTAYYFYFFKSKNKQTKTHEINNRLTNNFIIEPIISIENIGQRDVYDIYVENENHNFYANNIVVHNSTLNKVRRVFRQLVLAEDAMLTYRLIRAGEKKVFKIDVGNIDEDDVEEYMYKVSEKFKRTPQIDQNNGQIDYRFNIMGVDEDFFIPVRNANVQTGIDTLPGASNLNDINDISYLRDNLFIGLGIPKPFLSFQDASGGGKNIAQFDIRFSKKVNRIQQAMIQELNKMAMIHLYYLGFEAEDLNNFALSLTNPSTQQELLKIELLQAKAQVYGDMTRAEAGIAAMSHTNAKRQILNMSDSDIVEDLRQQKMEKVIMQEFADSPVVIKKTGLFADIDKKYGVDSENMSVSGATSPTGGAPMGGGGGGLPPMGGGGAPMGGGMPPTEGEPSAEGEIPPLGGEEGETPKPIAGLPNQSPSDLPPIKEGMRREMDETTYNRYVNKLVYGDNHKENTIKQETSKLIMETESNVLDLNSKALNLINEIENMVSSDKNIIQDVSEDDSDINLNELNKLNHGYLGR